MSPSVNPRPECKHIVRGTFYLADYAPQPPYEGIRLPCEQDRCTEELLVWRKTPRECARSKEGHVAQPSTWPPRARRGAKDEQPSIAVQCVQCGVHLVLYDDEQDGITVVKPPTKPERKVAV